MSATTPHDHDHDHDHVPLRPSSSGASMYVAASVPAVNEARITAVAVAHEHDFRDEVAHAQDMGDVVQGDMIEDGDVEVVYRGLPSLVFIPSTCLLVTLIFIAGTMTAIVFARVSEAHPALICSVITILPLCKVHPSLPPTAIPPDLAIVISPPLVDPSSPTSVAAVNKDRHAIPTSVFDGLARVQTRLLEHARPFSTSEHLAVDINHAVLTAKELAVAVRASDLDSKHLSDALDTFARDAKHVGRELQRLSAKAAGVVDT